MSTHSLLAPSDAERWARCAGAIHLSRGVVDPDAEYSASGTCSHWLLAWALTNPELKLAVFLGKEMEFSTFKFVIDEERIERVQTTVDNINAEPGRMWVEKLVNTTPVLGVPGQSGHADVVKLDLQGMVEIDGQPHHGVVSVHDFKDGYILVHAKNNLQGLCYGAAALFELDLIAPINAVRFVIHQPKMNHYSEWTYSRAEIEHFCSIIRPAAKMAYDIYTGVVEFDATKHLNAGEEQCFWCPVRGRCPARAKRIADMFTTMIGKHEIDDPALEQMYLKLDEVEAACRDFRGEMLRRALSGRVFKEHKIVRGKRGKRYWIDKAKAESIITMVLPEEQAFEPREIISPTQAEKLLKKDGYTPLKQLVGQPEGGYTVVPVTDKREAITVQTFAPIMETKP
jgi:hypothetical protein